MCWRGDRKMAGIEPGILLSGMGIWSRYYSSCPRGKMPPSTAAKMAQRRYGRKPHAGTDIPARDGFRHNPQGGILRAKPCPVAPRAAGCQAFLHMSALFRTLLGADTNVSCFR